MKSLILLSFSYCLAISSWEQNPIKTENKLINTNKKNISCHDLEFWLAQTTKKNKIIPENKKNIGVTWYKIKPKDAWQQYKSICQDTKKPMYAIHLKWLIIDAIGEKTLGINSRKPLITRSNLQPSVKLWHLINDLHEFTKILDFLLNDLEESKHLIAASEPEIVSTPNIESHIITNITIPFTVKTSRTTYNTMQVLPISLNIKYTVNNDHSINLQLNSKMHQSWEHESSWPVAISNISTNVNLSIGKTTTIAKQLIKYNIEAKHNHHILGILRDNSLDKKHALNLLVLASASRID